MDAMAAMQQVRTTAARYAEANVLLAQGNFVAARTVIQDMPVDKALKAPEVVEQQRMLSYITILETATNGGRSATELTTAEVNQLKALIVEQYDRPANWISNLLCLYYGECRAPRTGGEVGGQKNLRPTVMRRCRDRAKCHRYRPEPHADLGYCHLHVAGRAGRRVDLGEGLYLVGS
jgi:hypothetical protein